MTYRVTKKNMKYLKRWKNGKSIGFTMRSSLKAKGLIPRANGKKYKSPKYKSRNSRNSRNSRKSRNFIMP